MTDLSTTVNALIDAALETENAAQPARGYLGASEIGEPCERKLGYRWHKFPSDPFPGRVIRRFRLGHIHENETARWLKLAGFVLKGEQTGFELADGKFAGHIDGVIVCGPADMPYPVLWEHKIMKSSIWRQLSKSHVEAEQPKYFAQLQTYMRQLNLQAALFTSLNADTSEIYFEVVSYNAAKAQTYIDRAARIITSEHPKELPRIGRSEYDFECKFCPYKATCWEQPKVVETPAPAWLRR